MNASRVAFKAPKPWKYLLVCTLAFSINSNTWAAHPAATALKKDEKTNIGFTKEEREDIEREKERARLLGIRIMYNFGCDDKVFIKEGMTALIEHLKSYKENESPIFSKEDDFEEAHLKDFSGHIGIRHRGQLSNKKLAQEKGPYSDAQAALSELIRSGIYKAFPNKTPKDIARFLASNDARARLIKRELADAMKNLNARSDEDHLNVSCHGEKAGKNSMLVYERKEDGTLSKVPLLDAIDNLKSQKGNLAEAMNKIVDASTEKTVPTVEHKKTKEPAEVIKKAEIPKKEEKAKPKDKEEKTHTAKKQEEPAKEKTREPEPEVKSGPETKSGKSLFSRFMSWIRRRGKDDASDFHSVAMKQLKSQKDFVASLLNRNPLGKLCTNYLSLSPSKREKVLSKTLLVHLMSENFDDPSVENLGGGNTDSIGPWQTSMNANDYGCKFNSRKEIAFSLEKNIHCLFTYYTFREQNFGKIYGYGGTTVRYKGANANGLHWSVLKEGRGFFEEKFEPIFRTAVPECRDEYESKSDRKVVNGSSVHSIADMFEGII